MMGAQSVSPPPLEGGGWGEGLLPVSDRNLAHRPLPPIRKRRGSAFAFYFVALPADAPDLT
jgi:hypothetical protein